MEKTDSGKMKLSIIIPYFETIDLTKKLLIHLSSQLKDEVEIVLIDDGCKESWFDRFINQYRINNIKLKHQENMGVAKTRNKGIELAKGKYVSFIDCDDQVTSDYVDMLLNAIDKYDTDIINFNWLDLTENVVYRKPHNFAPWKAIYKKETMLKFREDREYGEEDIDFQSEINEKIKNGNYSITYLDRVLYLYNSNREGSLFWKKTHKEEIK